jgi:hypothetical protein
VVCSYDDFFVPETGYCHSANSRHDYKTFFSLSLMLWVRKTEKHEPIMILVGMARSLTFEWSTKS